MNLSGKKSEGDPRGRAWSLGEFADYFQREQQKEGNSRMFKEVAEAFGEFASLQDQLITQESAMKMVKAGERLRNACREYTDSRRNALSPSGRERLAMVDSLAMFEADLNLDQARDMKMVREREGKTWEQAGSFEMAEIELGKEKVEVVGANVNRRMKVEYGGKTGFFTSEFVIRSQEGYTREVIGGIDEKRSPDVKKVLGDHEKEIAERLEKLKDAVSHDSFDLTCISCAIGEQWNQMEEKVKGRKELGKAVIGDMQALSLAASVTEAYQKKVKDEKGDMAAGEKARLMDQIIQEKLGAGHRKLGKIMSDNKDFFMGIPSPDRQMKSSTLKHRYMRLGLIQIKAAAGGGVLNSGKKEIQALDKAIEDGSLIHEFIGAEARAASAGVAADRGELKEAEGLELTSRNVASTRIAELLGIGTIIARSEKMKVRSEGNEMTGCFMEFAKGIDYNSKDPVEQRMWRQMEINSNAGLNKSMTTLNVLDFLCGQRDRHLSNMFYQLSEPDENGKRTLVGLQGIDNDLAFGDGEIVTSVTQNDLVDLTLIDRELADKVRELDREALEYAIGDLIPSHQIDMMMKRVEKLQKHIKENMVEIEADDWELKEYDNVPQDKLDERGKAYLKAKMGIDRSVAGDMGKQGEAVHKSCMIKIRQGKDLSISKRAEAQENPIFEGMQNMFQEKKKVTFQDLQKRDMGERKTNIRIGVRKQKEAEPVREAQEKEKQKQAAGLSM